MKDAAISVLLPISASVQAVRARISRRIPKRAARFATVLVRFMGTVPFSGVFTI
jgi:hypothetical protein